MGPYREPAKPEEEPVNTVKKKQPAWLRPAILATICMAGIIWVICGDSYRWGMGLTLSLGVVWLAATAIVRHDQEIEHEKEEHRLEKECKNKLEKLMELKRPKDRVWLKWYVMNQAVEWIEKHKEKCP